MTATYTVHKRDGLWWVIDHDGYEVSYVGHPTKREALESARVREAEDRAAARTANHIDGYDRDDLGESPDY